MRNQENHESLRTMNDVDLSGRILHDSAASCCIRPPPPPNLVTRLLFLPNFCGEGQMLSLTDFIRMSWSISKRLLLECTKRTMLWRVRVCSVGYKAISQRT